MGNVAKYQHGWNMTFTVVELLMIIPQSTYLSISLPYFSIYHFFSLTLFVQDATGALQIYGTIGQTYKNGNVIPAGFMGTVDVYSGLI